MTLPQPKIRINLESKIPAYQQIAGELRALLVTGELPPGEFLAPVRQVAMDLGVHHNTVALAYRELAAEGWLDLCRGRGARVVQRKERSSKPEGVREFSLQLRHLVARAIAGGMSLAAVDRELDARREFTRVMKPEKGEA